MKTKVVKFWVSEKIMRDTAERFNTKERAKSGWYGEPDGTPIRLWLCRPAPSKARKPRSKR